MATVGLYGSSSSGVVAAASGSESIGLYGNGTNFGGSYFEWFIFQVANSQPATPTGGSWDFTTNSGTPPTGWSSTPPVNPTNTVWVSIALVNSKTASSLTWSAPGRFSYSSGLPIISGNGTPDPSLGQSDQLYIQLDTTPQTIWFKETGTWTRLTGSSLYVDTTSNQTIAGIKTFSSQIQGSINGTASNVTGVVDIANGGTNAITASAALTNLGGIGTITSSDGSITVTPAGTTVNLSVSQDSPASTLLTPVRNTTGATLTKGTVVYISGATGQIATVSKALATSDATSAQTLGMITTDLPNNTNGYVTVFGLLSNIDTSAYTDGAQLYLSGTTAGTVTATKPSAPTHLVYVAVVEYAHPTQGKLLVKVQNGYELEELHNVSITSPATGQTIIYNSSTSLWSNSTVSLTAGVNGTLPIANGGTGQTTANAAFNALAPSQTGNSGKYLTTDGTNTSWATNPLGTVTSVDVSGGTTGLTTSGGPITTSGTITLAGTLALTNGGTGATTAAGAATNLGLGTGNSPTFTGLTLSGGTANGVAYLNGSKVLTSGSALTFDGTNLSVGGTAPTNAGYTNLYLNNTTGAQLFLSVGGVNSRVIYSNSSGLNYYTSDASPHMWQISGSEQMRLTSTGLGIGTSSPVAKLHVNAGAAGVQALFSYSSGTPTIAIGNSTTTYNTQIGYNVSSEYGYIQAVAAAGVYDDIAINPNGGNVGIGTSSPSSKLEVVGGNIKTDSVSRWIGYWEADAAHDGYLVPYNGSGFTELVNSFGTGGLLFKTGTSKTERMRLDASGNLGIGTSSPAFKLDVASTAGTVANFDSTNANGPGLKFTRSGTANGYVGSAKYIVGGALADFGIDVSGANNLIFGTNDVERMRLDSSGNLGLGVTPSAWSGFRALQVGGATSIWSTTSGGGSSFYSNNVYYDGTNRKRINAGYAAEYIQDATSGGHNWYSAGSSTAGSTVSFTQVMTLDASGNLLVGTTSGFSNQQGFYFGAGAVSYTSIGHTTAAVSGDLYARFVYNGTGIGSITQNGTTGVLYNITSDQRLKENIVNAPEFGSVIDSIKVRSYDWKADGSHQRAGFIAQELVTVAPEAVNQPADPDEMMGVDYSKLVPMLVKEIQTLRKRLANAGIA